MRNFYRQVLVAAKRFFRPDSFLRHFAVLASGTAVAQLIHVLANPVLTRLYSPQDFGMFAVFMAIIGTLSPIICGKYEVALVLPKSRIQAEHILGIALYFSAAISGMLFIVLLISGENLLLLLKVDRLGRWVFLAPVVLLLIGFLNAVSYLANRNKQYRLMSQARIVRSVVASLVSIWAGIVGLGFGGLLGGFIVGLVSASSLLYYNERSVFSQGRIFSCSKAKRWLLCRYKDYPVYNATTGLLNGLTMNLPVFFLSRCFPGDVVGYYAVAMRAISTPISFISISVSQVNLKRVVDLYNAGKPIVPYLLKVASLLLVIISVPSLIVVLWGPTMFAFVFGKKWVVAGECARILMPGIAVQFIASTLSTTFGALNENKVGALVKLLIFLSTLAVMSYASTSNDVNIVLWALMVNNLFCYIVVFILMLFVSHGRSCIGSA